VAHAGLRKNSQRIAITETATNASRMVTCAS
jgi:hypothetical protein